MTLLVKEFKMYQVAPSNFADAVATVESAAFTAELATDGTAMATRHSCDLCLVEALLSERGKHISLCGVSWQYGMAHILFVEVENLRQYYGSPRCQGSVLHLLCESAASNNGMHPTAN